VRIELERRLNRVVTEALADRLDVDVLLKEQRGVCVSQAMKGDRRRSLTRWVAEGKLKAYSRAGDRKRYVDLEDIRKLQQLRPIDQ